MQFKPRLFTYPDYTVKSSTTVFDLDELMENCLLILCVKKGEEEDDPKEDIAYVW